MASIRSPSSSFLAVTITLALVVLTICGEIQTATASTVALDDAAPSVDRANGELSAPRTFGRIRMLKNVMLPLMFLLGGIKMLLLFLVAVSLKTLFIAMSIFVINISVGLAKVINFFKHGFVGHKEGWSGQDKNVHIHIHSDPSHHLSLEGPPPAIHSSVPPTIHSSVFPYARNDVIEPIYASPAQINHYNKLYMQGMAKQSLPYSGWQQTARMR